MKTKADELARLLNEAPIIEYKDFYKKYLWGIKERKDVFAQLGVLCYRFQNTSPLTFLVPDPNNKPLDTETKTFLSKHFPKAILEMYNKEIPREKETGERTFIDTYRRQNERYEKEWKHKRSFIISLHNRLHYYGLHPNIDKRDPRYYKRYSVMMEHNYKSPYFNVTQCKLLIKPNVLLSAFVQLFEEQMPIMMDGRLIPAKNIIQIKISSTLLLEDEIDLFASKHGFQMDDGENCKQYFITKCKNETDELLRNPHVLKKEAEKSKNEISFVDPIRIVHLKEIRSKDFDLIKLIAYCEELNLLPPSKSVYAPTMLARAIIDHIPPIFGFDTFIEVANSYSGGGSKAFKKSVQNLQNSLRPIADHNNHALIRKKEVLATPTQVSFAPDLDVLLGEIIRILK